MPEFLVSATPLSALLVLCIAGLALLGFGGVATSIFGRSLPGKVIDYATEANRLAEESLTAVRALRTEWAGTLEQLEHLLAQVDRKRRSIQGAEARMRANIQAQGAEGSEHPQESQTDRLIRLRREATQKSNGR